MRWPRFRVRLWVLLLLVALAAVAFTVSGFTSRARLYRALAANEISLAKSELASAKWCQGFLGHPKPGDRGWVASAGFARYRRSFYDAMKRHEQRAAEHLRRRDRFLRCARYPWLSPPAEASEPK